MFKRMVQRVMGTGNKAPSPVPPSAGDVGADRPPSPPSSATLDAGSIGASRASPPAFSIDLNLEIDLGGGRGWPTFASYVIFHNALGVLVVGTELGSVYVFGEGCQFMKANLLHGNPSVVSITELSEGQILVSFENNALLVLDIPDLNLVSYIGESWLRTGDVTCIRHDEKSDKRFVFVGTTDGYVLVLEVLPAAIREIDYMITLSELGLPDDMSVSDIQLHPKEEKYMAVAYDGSDVSEGAIVIWDFSKRKAKRIYQTFAITSLVWTHSGEVLYAGSRVGKIVCGGVERESLLNVWDSIVEKSEYAEDDGSEFLIPIRKMRWLAPQIPSNDSCLLVLLGAINNSIEILKSVIVGLIPNGSGSVDQVLAIPPLDGEAILSFSLVASQEKDNAAGSSTNRTPAILLLTEDTSNVEIADAPLLRYLKTIRCPSSAPKDWALEIGLLSDPMKVPDILPHTAAITSMAAVGPKSTSTSFSRVLLASAGDASLCSSLTVQSTPPSGGYTSPNSDSPKRSSTRMSMSAFEGFNITDEMNWKLILANATSESNVGHSTSQLHDIVFLGHSDGNVFAWNIVPVDKGGSGNIWVPLNAFKCGSTPVTVISHDNNSGVVAAGDASGVVTVWEIFESATNIGATAYFATQESERCPFHPDSIRKIYQSSTGGDSISSITMILDSETVVVGSDSGKLYVSLNWGSNRLCGSSQLTAASVGASGGVINTMYSTYWNASTNTAVPAVFVLFESGHIAVVNFTMMSFIACCPPPIGFDPTDKIAFSDILNSSHQSVLNFVMEEIDRSLFPEKPERASSGLSGIFKSRDRSTSIVDEYLYPQTAPRYLLYIRGKMVHTYDIAKFSILGLRFTSSSIPAPVEMWASSRKLTDAPILCAEKLAYVDEASRAWAQPIICLASIDADGAFYVHSFTDKSPICSVDLFLGVCDNSSPLSRGLVLQNGSCYVQQGDFMIHTGATVCAEYILNMPSPTKALIRFDSPDTSFQINDGRILKGTAVKQRKMSIMSAAPIDLSKLFNKTRDEHQKDELFGRRAEQEEREATDAAARALKVATETREALLERGRKLQQMAKTTEALGVSSEEYRQNLKTQTQRLKEKDSRWGLF